VTDTSIGIAPEDHDAVFEEFRQVGAADNKAEGTGLGWRCAGGAQQIPVAQEFGRLPKKSLTALVQRWPRRAPETAGGRPEGGIDRRSPILDHGPIAAPLRWRLSCQL
jgi:hypothetical protein